MNAAAQRCALAHILRLQEDAHLRVLPREFAQNFARAVLGAVIDAEQFDVDRHGENFGNHLAERIALVVDRHDDGKFHGQVARSNMKFMAAFILIASS